MREADVHPFPERLMLPDIHLNYFALVAALLAKGALGHLWYGRFFGKAWNQERGVNPSRESRAAHRRSLFLRWLGLALTVYVLALCVQIIRPSSWHAGTDGPSVIYGFFAAFFVWIGFYVPQLFARVAWEGASWKFLRIHAFYHFVVLQLAGFILTNWR
jgi:hypothetical protein